MVASTVYEREIGVAVVYPTLNKMSKIFHVSQKW